MTSTRSTSTNTKTRSATRRLESFRQRFGDGHFYLACHAALPLALTPDLLYSLWANFQRDIHGEAIDIPWIAVADLMLSSLCKEVGHELYEMDAAIRNELLNQLQRDPRFGLKRIQELADFIMAYVKQELNSPDLDTQDFAQAQQLRALAYKDPTEAAKGIALAISQINKHNKNEWPRFASLLETVAEPLAEFPALLTYVQMMANLSKGKTETAKEKADLLLNSTKQVQVCGVNLAIPEELATQPKPLKNINPIWLVGGVVGLVVGSILAARIITLSPPEGPCPSVSLLPSNQFQQPNSDFASDDIKIAGSTSMDNLNQSLKRGFEEKYPSSRVAFTSSGDEDGKQKLISGSVDLAAVSQHVSDEEFQRNNWKAFTVASSPIAVAIGLSNPYPKDRGLTTQQVREIFIGHITQWSQLQPGRTDAIRIINRNRKSGTRKSFQTLALNELPFGSASVVEEWPLDETYKVLNELKQNGIYYAACHQVLAQATSARILKIDGKMPTSDFYPYNRSLLYLYKVDNDGKPSRKVEAFLGFANSQEGRTIVQDAISGKKK